MCGIYGAFSTDAQRPIQADLLDRMAHVLAHRGPDGGMLAGKTPQFKTAIFRGVDVARALR